MKHMYLGNHNALVTQFSVDDDINVKEMFTSLWNRVLQKDGNVDFVRGIFVGIDLCRSSLIELFKTESLFSAATLRDKRAYLYAINKALEKSIEEEQMLISNGISFFILWLVCVLKKEDETKLHIEQCFSQLRSQYGV